MNSRIVKKFIKSLFDKTCRVESINGTRNGKPITHYIRVWGDFTGCKSLRTIALRVIYSEKFAINEQAIAGNVQNNSISMSPSHWEQVVTIFSKPPRA